MYLHVCMHHEHIQHTVYRYIKVYKQTKKRKHCVPGPHVEMTDLPFDCEGRFPEMTKPFFYNFEIV